MFPPVLCRAEGRRLGLYDLARVARPARPVQRHGLRGQGLKWAQQNLRTRADMRLGRLWHLVLPFQQARAVRRSYNRQANPPPPKAARRRKQAQRGSWRVYASIHLSFGNGADMTIKWEKFVRTQG
jgi:hypothetical protein